jgi:DNA-binding transcriptional LysR family regulator
MMCNHLTGGEVKVLNLSEMQVFAVAAETENFSEAARRIHLSQPAVSQQIRSLENYFGVQLFTRSGRGVTLTDAGKILLPLARELLDLSHRTEETMRSLKARVAGHLTIGCTTTAGKYVLPIMAAAFSQHHPDVEMTIEMCNCASVVDPLLALDICLGISSTKIVHRDIECQPFFTDYVVLVVPADHPFAQRSSVQPAELLGQPFILREESSSTYLMLQEGLAEHGIRLDQMNVVMVVGNAEAIEIAVEQGLGIAFISRLAARHGLLSGRLVEVPVEGLHPERPLYMVRNTRCAKTLAQERLWDFFREHREIIVKTLEM